MDKQLMDASCRVALAGLIHGIEIPARRAQATLDEALAKVESVSPGLARGNVAPFSPDEAVDDNTFSAVIKNLEKEETLLSAVIRTASLVSEGFEREPWGDKAESAKNDAQLRLRSLLEEVRLGDGSRVIREKDLHEGYPLKPLSAASLFPAPLSRIECIPEREAAAEYKRLWQQMLDALTRPETAVPAAFKANWPLWLDAFDTCWLAYTQSIPLPAAAGIKPDVSLYDHSKTTAALAVALWRWHDENGAVDEAALAGIRDHADWNEEKILLIQGDFFGIQNFIFSEGSETNKHSAKILRGRSFYVSLLCELAALRVLEALSLPSTSQILNAAGKFMIVAPNTESTRRTLERVRGEFDRWFLDTAFGTCGMGIASTPASCEDFVGKHYEKLTDRLFEALEASKYRRFDLSNLENPVFDATYPNGVCRWQQRMPADGKADGASCALSRDQILIGKLLTTQTQLHVFREGEEPDDDNLTCCEVPLFGYRAAFGTRESGRRVKAGLVRSWDFSLPENEDEVLWHGLARRNINGFVPRFTKEDLLNPDAVFGEDDARVAGAVKTFETLSLADTRGETGVQGLMTLKGDVDNLGMIFRRGLTDDTPGRARIMTFAKTASLSRRINAFFSVHLPVLCAREFRNVYTVFAGGDDFFLIGPWRATQRLAEALEVSFKRFACNNPDVHFSVGLVMTKPAVPARTLAAMAEEGLSAAKSFEGKNRVMLYGQAVTWDDLHRLNEVEEFLSNATERYGISSVYLYSLFELIDMAGDTKRPEASMWRSRLYYNTARLFERQRMSTSTETDRAREEFLRTLLGYIQKYGAAVRIPLTNTFYNVRQIQG